MEKSPAVTFGDKVVVLGSKHVESFRPIVTDITWIKEEHRYKIELLWGTGEESHVWSTDMGKTWMTEPQYNQKQLSVN